MTLSRNKNCNQSCYHQKEEEPSLIKKNKETRRIEPQDFEAAGDSAIETKDSEYGEKQATFFFEYGEKQATSRKGQRQWARKPTSSFCGLEQVKQSRILLLSRPMLLSAADAARLYLYKSYSPNKAYEELEIYWYSIYRVYRREIIVY